MQIVLLGRGKREGARERDKYSRCNESFLEKVREKERVSSEAHGGGGTWALFRTP